MPGIAPELLWPAVQSYIRRGWATVALHDVSDGYCSCGEREPNHERGQWGKHPRWAGWRKTPLRTFTEVTNAWLAAPTANIGIVTGRISNLWVLDVDPAHGGMEYLTQLWREHQVTNAWADLYQVATGGGGLHFYFWVAPNDAMPTDSRGKLPAGLDVRGEGGQVVAPPSVTGKGKYVARIGKLDSAPRWLIDLVCSQSATPPAATPKPLTALTASDYERGSRYAVTAVNELLTSLSLAPEGGRNDAAFRTSARLLEILNAPWAGLDRDRVYQGYLNACAHASANGGAPFSEYEAIECWRKAIYRIGDKQAVLPDNIFATEAIAVPPMLISPGTIAVPDMAAPVLQDAAMLQWENAVTREVWRQAVIGEAKARLNPSGLTVDRLRESLLDRAGLARVKPLEPLINGWLWRDTLARVVGASHVGKTFLTLSMAGSVATGIEWAGQGVSQGRVLYLIAEGLPGMMSRLYAWENVTGRIAEGITWLPQPIQVGDPKGWGALVKLAEEMRPAFIVIDTQARISVGMKENDATDMGILVDAAETLRMATGACVLLVHHTGYDDTHARGSTAVYAALQTELMMTTNGDGSIGLKVTKQKDSQPLPPLQFKLRPVALSVDLVGHPFGSAVMQWQPISMMAADLEIAELNNAIDKLTYLMYEIYSAGIGGTKGEVRAVAISERSLMSKSTFDRTWSTLLERKVIGRVKGTASYRYIPPQDRERVIEAVGGKDKWAFYAPESVNKEHPPAIQTMD